MMGGFGLGMSQGWAGWLVHSRRSPGEEDLDKMTHDTYPKTVVLAEKGR